jgi:hypothetical protein
VRAPPEFREELHPDEIVHRPCRSPFLGAIAVAVAVVIAAILLRAVRGERRDAPTMSELVARRTAERVSR